MLERLDYQLLDNPPGADVKFDQPSATELFHRQVFACFWFEEPGPSLLLEKVGFDNVMFETDFPHGTCLYPNAMDHAKRVLAPWGPDVARRVLQDNAAKLYRLAV